MNFLFNSLVINHAFFCFVNCCPIIVYIARCTVVEVLHVYSVLRIDSFSMIFSLTNIIYLGSQMSVIAVQMGLFLV